MLASPNVCEGGCGWCKGGLTEELSPIHSPSTSLCLPPTFIMSLWAENSDLSTALFISECIMLGLQHKKGM